MSCNFYKLILSYVTIVDSYNELRSYSHVVQHIRWRKTIMSLKIRTHNEIWTIEELRTIFSHCGVTKRLDSIYIYTK